jgi:hypothetical protein
MDHHPFDQLWLTALKCGDFKVCFQRTQTWQLCYFNLPLKAYNSYKIAFFPADFCLITKILRKLCGFLARMNDNQEAQISMTFPLNVTHYGRGVHAMRLLIPIVYTAQITLARISLPWTSYTKSLIRSVNRLIFRFVA